MTPATMVAAFGAIAVAAIAAITAKDVTFTTVSHNATRGLKLLQRKKN